MKTFYGIFKKSLVLFLVIILPGLSSGREMDHIEALFAIRDSITTHGNILPEKIRDTRGNDLRTLERIYELNTSTLTTLEAYFRLLMIALSTGTESKSETIDTLNEWLTFIQNQCNYDIDYLDSTLEETDNGDIIEQIKIARENSIKLSEIAEIAKDQNKELLKDKTVN